MGRVLLMIISLVCLVGASETSGPLVERVVVVVVDGPRWSETWGEASRAHIPRRALERAPQGVLFTGFLNRGPTHTNSGHAGITTGVAQDIDNSGKQLPSHESWMQRWRFLNGSPAESAWVVTSKDKLAILGDTVDPSWAGRCAPRLDCGIKGLGTGYRSDPDTQVALRRILRDHAPTLLIVNLLGPDANGHARKWEGYLAAIRETDAMVGDLWAELQSLPTYRGRTALFVTNDHGRHLDGIRDGFVSHDDQCPGCKHIELLAIVPGVAGGQVVAREHDLTDLAVTIARLIGTDLPASRGVVIPELIPALP